MKMIILTETIIEEKVDVDPVKMVEGLEPERTNVFLRALCQAATSGVDSTPHIQLLFGIVE